MRSGVTPVRNVKKGQSPTLLQRYKRPPNSEKSVLQIFLSKYSISGSIKQIDSTSNIPFSKPNNNICTDHSCKIAGLDAAWLEKNGKFHELFGSREVSLESIFKVLDRKII